MKIISSALLFVLITAVLGQSENNTTTTEDTTTVATTEATTTSSRTTPTTEPTTTTVETTTTSTSEASTTTVMPTSSSTAISSSTTAVSTTSSEAPTTKAPSPPKCEFNVTVGNLTCIRAELQAEFTIYEGEKYSRMLVCGASLAGSDCSNDTQTLALTEPTTSEYSLTMVFEKLAGKVLVKNVTFSYNLPGGPRGIVSSHSEDLFKVKEGNSYLCKSKSDIHLGNVTVEISEVHIQAFLEEGKTYGATEQCEADEKVSDIVPIAVGIALAALIIIVLIAYLVGRRRSRQKGYQSV